MPRRPSSTSTAAGAAGFDPEGHETTWPASLTDYDAATGEIQVLYGVVGRDTWLSFPAQR